MEYSKDRLDLLHESLLEILNFIDRFCSANNLKYYLIGGTALGARRHKGFIPWDDDLDIGMPRLDYEKFRKLMYKLDDRVYRIQDETTEPNYFLPFAKIRKQGTIFREYVSKDLYKDNGLFVDVFPIDTFSKIDGKLNKLELKKAQLIKHELRFRYCKWYYKERFDMKEYSKAVISAIPYACYSRDDLFRKLKKISVSQIDKSAKFAANIAGTNKICREIMPYDVFYPLKLIKFEGREYPCVNDIDTYLTNLYGDFMKLPPAEKRRTHEPLELKF